MSKKPLAYLTFFATVIGFFVVGAMTTEKPHYEWLGWIGAGLTTLVAIIKYPREKQESVVAYKTEEELRAERLETIAHDQLTLQRAQAAREAERQAALDVEQAHNRLIADLSKNILEKVKQTRKDTKSFGTIRWKEKSCIEIFGINTVEALEYLQSEKLSEKVDDETWEFPIGRVNETNNRIQKL